MSIFTSASNGKTSAKETQPVILRTSDYSKFKILKANRKINERHVERLVNSFKQNYRFTVIHVNESLEIIDGQHRFTAARRLNLPIYYTIVNGANIRDVQVINSNQQNWKCTDYLESYCASGSQPYLDMKQFMEDFPDLKFQVAKKLLTNYARGSSYIYNTNISAKDFENGNFKISSISKAYAIAKKIMDFKDYFPEFSQTCFVNAIIPLFQSDIYDHKRMIAKLKISSIRPQRCANTEQYRLHLQKIYNWKAASDDLADFLNIRK